VFWVDVAANETVRVDSVGDGFFEPSWSARHQRE